MEDRFIPILARLVAINSINPTLAGGPGEAEIAHFVAGSLSDAGLQPSLSEIASGRFNVTCRVEGTRTGRALLLNAHLDTVGAEGMSDPFTLRRDGDRLYGRGAYDMKGSVAVMLVLAESLASVAPPVDVLLTFVADEEDRSLGMEWIVNNWLPQQPVLPFGGIFLEPTELDIGVCHRGFAWYEIEIEGKAAHGSRPEQGCDAILPLGAALTTLQSIQSRLKAAEPHPRLGRPGLHAGTVDGGSALSVIPAKARLDWERRTNPGEDETVPRAEFEEVLAAVRKDPGEHAVSGREVFSRAAHTVEDEAEIVRLLRHASPESDLVGLSFWADSALGAQAGIPSVLFGPLGHGAHAVDEWVSLESLSRVYDVLKRVVEAA